MSDCRISVIISSLNEEKYIEDTLKSLKSQNYEGNYKIIVVDGNSKDKTVEIAKRYADKVIKLENNGVGKQRNFGAKYAKGDILLFVDADTIPLFDSLRRVDEVFREKDIVGAVFPLIPKSSKAKDFLPYWIFNQFVKSTINRKTQAGAACFACRKDSFNEIGGFKEDNKIGEDFDFSEKLSKTGKIKFIENGLALTSPRRMEKWGRLNSIGKHMKFYLNKLITGENVKAEEYVQVR